jgi:hypothetical protein
VVAVALSARLAGLAAGRVFVFLAPLLALVVLAAPLPGLRALTGPPLLAVVLGGLAVALAARGWRPPRAAFLPVVLALYGLTAVRVQQEVGPRGDEPHYLMVAESLLRDRDLSLERDYQERRYQPFHPEPLEPHYRLRGRHGEVYSLHAVGLSLLLLPAYAAGGYPAASLLMAVLAALLAREIRELARDWTGRDGAAEGVGWVVALSPPLAHYAGLVFTEVPAALLLALALRGATRVAADPPRRIAPWALGLAFLPWLNVRYAILAALIFLYALWRRPCARRAAVLMVPSLLSGALLAWHHWRLYGFFDPRRVYGRRPEFALATLPEGLPGLLLDQEFGLLVYAPAFVLALPGLVALWRIRRRECVVSVLLLLAVLLTAGSWHMWRGGFNPPARFLVPVLPVLAVALAMAVRDRLGAGAALALGWGLWLGAAGILAPGLVHRDRDSTAPVFRAWSGAEEWTRLLPGYVLSEPDRHALAAVWAAALALVAARAGRGHAGARSLAVATAGLLAASAVASRLSDARTGGRDSVRVIGRPALTVPRVDLSAHADGRWPPAVLDWGPLYEPHRHPGGALIGDRLCVPPGAYRLIIAGEDLSGGAAAPSIEVRPERGPTGVSVISRRGLGGVVADLFLPDAPFSVRLLGGGPFVLKEIALEAIQPSPPADGPMDRR